MIAFIFMCFLFIIILIICLFIQDYHYNKEIYKLESEIINLNKELDGFRYNIKESND